MIDTHCHLTYDGLYERADAVVASALAEGVDRFITIATKPDEADKALALADRFLGVFVGLGLHPHYSAQWADRKAVVDYLLQYGKHPGVVALGEMGLDHHYPDPPIEVQRRALEWQLEAAGELEQGGGGANQKQISGKLAPSPQPSPSEGRGGRPGGLPIIIHNREATDETLVIIRGSGLPGSRFVFHCFTGSDAELDAILAFGAMVGFTGIVTFKSAVGLARSALRVPLDRLLIETDSPYLTPEPHRKVKVNEPRYLAATARFLAAGRNMSVEEFTAAVDANARRFFRLPI